MDLVTTEGMDRYALGLAVGYGMCLFAAWKHLPDSHQRTAIIIDGIMFMIAGALMFIAGRGAT